MCMVCVYACRDVLACVWYVRICVWICVSELGRYWECGYVCVKVSRCHIVCVSPARGMSHGHRGSERCVGAS